MADDYKTEVVDRSKVIVQASYIGIITNVVLAAFKAVVGILSHSIAITLDAVNNLSDALSSVITIAGTYLAGKKPDKKHPYGHGRIEYLSALIIVVIVLYAGVTSFIESVKKIITPETPDYSAVTLLLVAVAVVAKLLLGRYVKKTGERVNSESLIDSGADALNDAIISAATLVAAIIFLTTNVSIEAWLGAVIAVVIIKSGYEMLRSTLSQIIGERPDHDLTVGVKKTVTEEPEVRGAFDLVLNNYGPDTWQGSIHVEVPDTMTAAEIDAMTRRIQYKVFKEHHVILTAVGLYSINTRDPKAVAAYEQVRKIVFAHDGIMQMHGFFMNEKEKLITFDVIIDFAQPDRHELYKQICEEAQAAFPDYTVHVTMDIDVSD